MAKVENDFGKNRSGMLALNKAVTRLYYGLHRVAKLQLG